MSLIPAHWTCHKRMSATMWSRTSALCIRIRSFRQNFKTCVRPEYIAGCWNSVKKTLTSQPELYDRPSASAPRGGTLNWELRQLCHSKWAQDAGFEERMLDAATPNPFLVFFNNFI